MPVTLPADVVANLDGLTTVFTQLNSWISSLVTTIASNSLLLVSVGIFVCGAVIGLAYRLIRGNLPQKNPCLSRVFCLLSLI